MQLGIIGTAGRKEPIAQHHWDLMLRTARLFLAEQESAGSPVTSLISGGAAGADHVAVSLFLQEPHRRPLFLELAAPWDFDALGYAETDGRDWLTNPGRTLNLHHRNFQHSAGVASFAELQAAFQQAGCQARAHPSGLRGRNTVVAEMADVLLAMTFGPGRQVAPGGTADTCRKYLALGKGRIYHLDLNTGGLWADAQVPSEKKPNASSRR